MNITLVNLATDPPSVRLTVSGIVGSLTYRLWRVASSGIALSVGGGAVFLPSDPFTVDVTGLVEGSFFATAQDNTGFSSLVCVVATKGDKAVLTRVRQAVRSHILTLGLPLIDVYEQWTPDDSDTDFPCVVLTHQNTTQSNDQVIVGTKDVGEPIRVMICDRVSKYEHDRMPDYDWWRQIIWDAFDNKRLPGITEALECSVEPDTISDAESVPFSLMVSQLVIRVKTRQPSGY